MSEFNSPIGGGVLPHKGSRGGYKATISNLKALLNHYGFKCHYNAISKEQLIVTDKTSNHDLIDNANYALISSLLALNDLPQSTIDLLPFIMAENTINPVMDFINEAKTGSLDYFQMLADTLIVDDCDIEYRNLVLKTWLLQCVAAADYAQNTPIENATPKFEYVLVLQGEQGIGKSTWLKNLLPSDLQVYFAENEYLDPKDVNSLRRCLSCWICELGELDAIFKRADVERLKAFLSQTVDKIRLPYDRAISNYKRRTSFCASVNPTQFLIDKTGNRRYLPIKLKDIEYSLAGGNKLFLAGLWSQVFYWYRKGEQWWPNEQLKEMLKERHEQHSETSSIEELFEWTFDLENTNEMYAKHFILTKALFACGINNPTRFQLKEAKAFIEKKGFVQKINCGVRGYYLNVKLNQ